MLLGNLPVYSIAFAIGQWATIIHLGEGVSFQLLFLSPKRDKIRKSRIFLGGVEVFPSFVPESKTDKILKSHIFGGGGSFTNVFPESKTDKISKFPCFPGVGAGVVFWVCETSGESLGRVFLLPVGCDCLYHTGFPLALEK